MDALPDGAEVFVKWGAQGSGGGDGPHRYRVKRDGSTPRATNIDSSCELGDLTNVGTSFAHTRVFLQLIPGVLNLGYWPTPSTPFDCWDRSASYLTGAPVQVDAPQMLYPNKSLMPDAGTMHRFAQMNGLVMACDWQKEWTLPELDALFRTHGPLCVATDVGHTGARPALHIVVIVDIAVEKAVFTY